MLVVTGVFENERFIPDRPVNIPQKRKVVVTIEEQQAHITPESAGRGSLPAEKRKVDINKLMEGSITQSLIGAVAHPDISLDEIRSLRLRKYDGNH